MQVSHYLWAEKSAAIEQMDVRKLPSGRLEARLYAADGLAQGALEEVPHHLAIVGYKSAYDSENGKQFLRVTGFEKPEDVLQVLERNAHIPPPSRFSQSGEEPKRSFREKFAPYTVQASGTAGVLGHIALGIGGILGNKKDLFVGLLYGSATSIYAIKGNGTPGGEVEAMMGDIEKYLAGKGFNLPEGGYVSAQELTKKEGLIPTVQEYFNKYPLQIGNAIGVLGNLVMISTGFVSKKNKAPGEAESDASKKANIFKPLSGAASMAGGIIASAVPEKPNHLKGQGVEGGNIAAKAWDALRDNPMRVSGTLQMTSNLMMIGNILETHKKYAGSDKQQVMTLLAATTAASWLLSGLFGAMSSKTPTKDYSDEEAKENLSALCANMVAQMPAEERGFAIDMIADQVAKRPDMNVDKEQISSIITQKVNETLESPWKTRATVQKATAHLPAQQSAVIS